MGSSLWKTPVLVIADDFTGANDAGSGLAQAGARVQVLFDTRGALPEATDVLVVSTESRAVSAPLAAERVTQAVRHFAAQFQPGWLFKKIDSTLRGNIGAETAAALKASAKTLALVAPAVPRLGRTTRGGHVRVHQRLLTDTEFASDPKTPIASASVLKQMQIAGSVLDLATLRSDRLDAVLAAAHGIVVVDAETGADLARLIAAAARLSETPLLVGAAGLSDALGAALRVRLPRPVLAVVGSMSESGQQQVATLLSQRDAARVDVDIRQLFRQPAWPDRDRWIDEAAAALRAGRHTVITTCQHAAQRHEIAQLCQHFSMTRQQLGEAICQFLGDLTYRLCRTAQPHALYLSGGDVAMAVARALGASGFTIQGLVADCVPHGVLLNSELHLPVMTKAGGFGDENTLAEAIRFIEEKSSE